MFCPLHRTSSKRILKRIFVTSVMVTIFSLSMVQPNVSADFSTTANQSNADIRISLKQAVQEAIDQLAQHQPFTSWKQANVDIQPLGPGTHGWLVRILDSKKHAIGYLIIHTNEQGQFQLTEYGIGTEIPYDHLALQQAMKMHAIKLNKNVSVQPVYYKPLIAAWKVQATQSTKTKWIDAVTGELLPEEWMKQLEQQHSAQQTQRQQSHNNTSLTTSTHSSGLKNTHNRRTINLMNNGNNDNAKRVSTIIPWQANASIQRQSFDPYENILWMMSDKQIRGTRALQWMKQWNPTNVSDDWIYVIRNQRADTHAWSIPYALVGKQQWTSSIDNVESSKSISTTPLFLPHERYVIVSGANTNTKRWITANHMFEHGYVTSNTAPSS